MAQKTVISLLWMGYGKGGQSLLRVLALVILARLLTPEDFGVVGAAVVVVEFCGIFSQLGLGPALVLRRELEPRHVQTAFAVSLAFGVVIGAAIWLSAPVVATFFRTESVEPVIRALAWVFPVKGLSVVAESLLQRDLRFRWLANVDVIAYAAGYGVVGIGLAAAGFGVWALVGATMCESIGRTCILLVTHPPPRRLLPEKRAFMELMYFGGGFTTARFAGDLALQGDKLVVGRWLGPAALGLYGRAYELMARPAALFGQILDDVLFPTMARVQGDLPRLAAAYRRGVALIALVMLPTSVMLFLLAPEVIYLVLGPKWADVTVPFQILTVGMLLRTSYKMSDSLVRATGAVYRRAWRQLIYAFLVIAGAWIGQHWGIAGVALGVLGALAVNFVLMAQLGLREAQMTWGTFGRAHLPALMLAAASGGVVWVVAGLLRQGGAHPGALVLAAMSAALVCAMVVTWCAPRLFLGPDGLWILEVLRSFVPKPSNRSARAKEEPVFLSSAVSTDR